MRVAIEIPTWLGDAIMTTPAIENIVKRYPKCEIIIFGSFVSTKLFGHHPNVKKIIIDDSKIGGNRYLNLYKLAKSIGRVDLAFSFRKNFTTRFLLWFVDAKEKYIYKRYRKNEIHQVIRYNDFINISLKIDNEPNKLKIYLDNQGQPQKTTPTVGLNPGATYGSAKRWYPEEFAKVAIELSDRYDIVIFGGVGERDIASDIEKRLIEADIKNYKNLAGETSVEELIGHISKLDLFITNDSGPMHLAAAFAIPTVAIFGPTRHIETHQWMNKNEMLIRKEMDCSPCMKRVCPLKHHECMKLIRA
ncbi:glycosyltransferase family 9 protein, partial [Sulfurovum sp. bin170]|uniref:glycosyltransferase family 9 protein n=1 Tax=Sulfurovum sp. bin170 TaxID=2695268 RepID=UPI0013DF5983